MPKPNDKPTKTNAMRVLDQHRIPYEAHFYSPEVHSADEVARILGVDPARVRVGEPRELPAAERGIPTELALHAAESAAAGRTAPKP